MLKNKQCDCFTSRICQSLCQE
uniref:Uncharacterized protein n=1 Tax=Anguilla anguilla TaxID=7936 RepID=A0A0E9P5U6_ANGAN